MSVCMYVSLRMDCIAHFAMGLGLLLREILGEKHLAALDI